MVIRLVFFLFASFMRITSGADWCYHSEVTCNQTCTGPEVWEMVSQHCSGRAQSPINIVTKKMLPDERLTRFHFIGYQQIFHSRLRNNGHTVELDLPPGIRIRGGGLPASYKAVQMHLHWGKDGGAGSEHTVDGEHFPMEMHIVHIKEEYSSLSQAVKDHTGVAVLGFFYQGSRLANRRYEPLITALKHIHRPSSSSTLRGVSLDMLIPPHHNLTRYYRYHGSLTTPDCSEAVVWTLFENPIRLSRKQITAFGHLWFSNGRRMVQTFRPLQPMNGRKVYYSGGHVSLVSTMLLLISVLLSSSFYLLHAGCTT